MAASKPSVTGTNGSDRLCEADITQANPDPDPDPNLVERRCKFLGLLLVCRKESLSCGNENRNEK